MNVSEVLREQLAANRYVLDATIGELTEEQLHYQAGGLTHSIAAIYGHAILSLDRQVHATYQAKPSLAETTWASRLGVSEPLPAPGSGGWAAWAIRVRMDLPTFRTFAGAAYAAADDYFAGLSEADLDRERDTPNLGKHSLNWYLYLTILQHHATHLGEISAIKGILGLRGYPF